MQLSYKLFPSPGPDYGEKVLAKLTEFNSSLSPSDALSESEVLELHSESWKREHSPPMLLLHCTTPLHSLSTAICSELSKPPPSALYSEGHCQLLYTMLDWPRPLLFPGEGNWTISGH